MSLPIQILAALIVAYGIFYAGQRFERTGWLQNELETQRQITEHKKLEEMFQNELEVKSVQLSKTTADLANANRVATERLRHISQISRESSASITRANDAIEAQRVLSIRVAALENYLIGLDRLVREADEINDAYSICRSSMIH